MYPAYIVIIFVPKDSLIEVGALGKILFKRGYYIYVGSGGRNPYLRIKRHFTKRKRVRWHIDYLTRYYPAVDGYIIHGLDGGEVELARLLARCLSSIKRFGASDKPSKSHLFYISNLGELTNILRYLEEIFILERVFIRR